MSQKVIDLLEQLLQEVKNSGCACATADTQKPRGNRTRAVMDYDGSDNMQNLVDVARRAVRYAREGKKLSKKERKVARQVIKAVKAEYGDVLNTNGHDIWSLNGL